MSSWARLYHRKWSSDSKKSGSVSSTSSCSDCSSRFCGTLPGKTWKDVDFTQRKSRVYKLPLLYTREGVKVLYDHFNNLRVRNVIASPDASESRFRFASQT